MKTYAELIGRPIEAEIKNSAITHLDVLGLNVLMSDEANTEVADFMKSPRSMVDANGHLIYGLADGRLCRFALMATTYHSLES